jgi:hypothetical protein
VRGALLLTYAAAAAVVAVVAVVAAAVAAAVSFEAERNANEKVITSSGPVAYSTRLSCLWYNGRDGLFIFFFIIRTILSKNSYYIHRVSFFLLFHIFH